jgi:hypothetical protein
MEFSRERTQKTHKERQKGEAKVMELDCGT